MGALTPPVRLLHPIHSTPRCCSRTVFFPYAHASATSLYRRLKQKDEEWRRAQRDWNKKWKDVHSRFVLRSLDHQVSRERHVYVCGVNQVGSVELVTSASYIVTMAAGI